MANLREILAYYCSTYPHPHELSKARITKMVYLADWRSSIVRGKQVSPVPWFFHQHGPFVDDVAQEIARNPEYFAWEESVTMYGNRKQVVKLAQQMATATLSPDEREILDFVVAQTAPLNFREFIQLVYSTYPVVSQPKFTKLDLVELAARYKREKNLIEAPATL